MERTSIEKALKRHLKKSKTIGYSASLLVMFLITGGLAFGNNVEKLELEKNIFLEKIQQQKARIKEQISQNEKKMEELNKGIHSLVKEGDWYSKPVFESSQVLVTASHTEAGKMKNRTEKEFSKTIDAHKKKFGDSGTTYKEALEKNNGVFIDNSKYSLTIDVGANITPITPILPQINPSLDINISIKNPILGVAPVVFPPTINMIKDMVVIPPSSVGTPTPPSVTPPTITPVAKVDINKPQVDDIVTPSDKNIVVNAPTTPEGFEPIITTPPIVPNIIAPTLDISLFTPSSSNDSFSWAAYEYFPVKPYHNDNDNTSLIDQISIKTGKFKLVPRKEVTVLDYTGTPGISATAPGIIPNVAKGELPQNGYYPITDLGYVYNNQNFFSINNSAFIEWGSEVEISYIPFTIGSEFIISRVDDFKNAKPEDKGSTKKLEDLRDASVITGELFNEIDGYRDQTGLREDVAQRMGINLYNNKGTIYLGGEQTKFLITSTAGMERLSVYNNEGNIIGLNMKYDTSGNISIGSSGQEIYSYGVRLYYRNKFIFGNGEKGKINLYGAKSIAMNFKPAEKKGSIEEESDSSFVNNGEINLYGIQSSGVIISPKARMTDVSGFYLNAPVNIYSDGSMGIYINDDISNLDSSRAVVRVNIGANKNDTAGVNWVDIHTDVSTHVDSNGNISGKSTDTVDNAIGVLFNDASTGSKIQTPNITLEKFSRDSMGIVALKGKLTVDSGEINIRGGVGNIAILSMKKEIGSDKYYGGDIAYTGNINISSSSLSGTVGGTVDATSAMAAYTDGKKIDIKGNLKVKSKDSVTLYATSSKLPGAGHPPMGGGTINIDGKISIESFGNNAVGLYATSGTTDGAFGTITTNRATLSSTDVDIDFSVIGNDSTGIGMYVDKGGKIDAKNNYIKVTNGSTGIVSVGAGSKIDLSGGILEYKGQGYAVYSKDNGTIDLQKSTIILDGKSTAFEIDGSPSAPPLSIILDQDSQIKVNSNDAIVFNLKNAQNLNTTGLESSVLGVISTALGGVNLNNLIVPGSSSINNYKVAAVDGGAIIIGNLNKAGSLGDAPNTPEGDGYFYYNRFLGQRLQATATGSTISAVLTNAQASKYKNQVVGLEMNSSKLAGSDPTSLIPPNAEAGIHLNNSHIIADRTEAGAGAIGAFINYGEVKIDGTSSIKVEKETINAANSGAVGVYAVNGSKVSNTGTILVGGDKSIGILGMAYREDANGDSVGAEFGTLALKQGIVDITNNANAKITLDGAGSIGIYAKNNNIDATVVDINVKNAGDIIVGNSTASSPGIPSNASVGIYGSKATISNTGNITVGTGGVAIYATEGSEITSVGTLNLGSNAIGVMVEGTSIISPSVTTINLNAVSGTVDTIGKTGVYYKGTGTEHTPTSFSINASSFKNGVAIYAENMNLTSSGNIQVGEDGVGIATTGSGIKTINKGTIDLPVASKKAIGMYGKDGATIVNEASTGNINITETSQIGMYAIGLGSTVENKGKIEIGTTLGNVNEAIGIYVNNGATANISENNNNIKFNGKENLGVYAEGSIVNFNENLILSDTNLNKNIFVYGKDSEVKIKSGKVVKVDGVASTATGEKTIGIYLEGTKSTFEGKLEVKNGAIGLYSKGVKELILDVDVEGTNTLGVLIDGTSTVSGKVNISNNGLGISADGGEVIVKSLVPGTAGLELTFSAGQGVGISLLDGAYVSGDKIIINNASPSLTTPNVGIYYTRTVAGAVEVTHGSTIEIAGNDTIGIYTSGGITVNNTKDIVLGGGNKNLGILAKEGSTYTQNSGTTITTTSTTGGIRMLASGGTIINESELLLNVSGDVGMIAQGDIISDVSIIENKGIITANSNIGMHLGDMGTNTGINSGTIIVTQDGIGVHIKGNTSTFQGGTGTINVASGGVGIYLEGRTSGAIVTGTLNIASGGIGFYGKDSVIDFGISTSNSTGEIALYADGNTTITNTVTGGIGSIGIYVANDNVALGTATTSAIVSVGNNSLLSSSVGIYAKDTLGSGASPYEIFNAKTTVTDGIGLYLGNNATPGTPATQGANVKYNGEITIGAGGVGVYVQDKTEFTNGTLTLNVTGGTGIYMTGGTANLGMVAGETLTFNLTGGTGILNKGGVLNLGTNIVVTGSGSLVATQDGTIVNNTTVVGSGNGSTGILGEYSSATVALKTITNTGTGNITASLGGIGIAAIVAKTSPLLTPNLVKIINNGTITATGKGTSVNGILPHSIGIYSDIADVENNLAINVQGGAIGISVDATANTFISTAMLVENKVTGTITLSGTDSIGIHGTGNLNILNTGTITDSGTNNVGIFATNRGSSTAQGTVTVNGDITIGNGGVGVIADTITSLEVNGNIVVGNSTDKTAVGIQLVNTGTVTIGATSSITVGDGGIGIYTKDSSITTAIDLDKITVGENGIYIYGDNTNFGAITGTALTVDNGTGIYLINNSTATGNIGSLTVENGGVGVYLENSNLTISNIIVQNGLDSANQSIGAYYKNMATPITLPTTITQNGAYTIGMVLEKTAGAAGTINMTTASNSVGVALKGSSSITTTGITASGAQNIGVHSTGGAVTVNGGITVFDSSVSADKSLSSIGVYAKGTTVSAQNLFAGNNSIGIYAEEMTGNVSLLGNMTVGNNGLGVYASGSTGGSLNVSGTAHTVGSTGGIGVYANGLDATVGGNFIIGAGTSIGIVSKGNGNIVSNGDMTIGDSSIGIYKVDGAGSISTTAGTNFGVSDKGYGIYLTNTNSTVNNNANMTLGEAAIGIYSNGVNTITNSGSITVGATDFGGDFTNLDTNKNSVGIFMKGGTTVTNIGTITVNNPLSVGVYSDEEGNTFINNNIINVDNGGIGVLVKDGAIAVNNGTINLGGTINTAGESIGMAVYLGSKITNSSVGTINVDEGIGMLVGTGGIIENYGTINITGTGTGIFGAGTVINTGSIIVHPGSGGTDRESGVVTSAGSVVIDKNGNITVNDQYVSLGGTLVVDGTVDVNGAFVDVTTGKPVFEGNSITGNINIIPNYMLSGEGSYSIEGFLNALGASSGSLTINPPDGWMIGLDRDGNPILVKIPYAETVVGDQFDKLHNGLTNILFNPNISIGDKGVLGEINQSLAEGKDVLGGLRGDVYSTVQVRMNTIDEAFDSSFNDLEKLYNQTKDSGKYGVIHSTGKFKDSTVGIDDFDYKVTGLLYMNEKEKVDYGTKIGYSAGFAVSEFEFKDGVGSKEDVYSLRGGVHKNKRLENEMNLLSQLTGSINYHKTDRKYSTGQSIVKNKGEYQSYSLELDNKLTKDLYNDYKKEVKLYSSLSLKYGMLDSFKEKGNLTLELDKNDYYSIKPEIGVNGEYRKYVSNNRSIGLFGNIGLAYELGEVYEGNKARLKEGGEGYYSLITPEKEKGSLMLKAGTKYGKLSNYDVILEAEAKFAENRDDVEMKYSLKLNYIF